MKPVLMIMVGALVLVVVSVLVYLGTRHIITPTQEIIPLAIVIFAGAGLLGKKLKK